MNLPPLTILIVEDEVDFRENLSKLLHAAFPGSTVEEASNVNNGLRLLDGRKHFDIVILDFRLPVSTGGQEIDTKLCDMARARHPDSLVIHVTSYENHEVAARHMKEAHPPCVERPVSGSPMETQHLGIVISKNSSATAPLGDQIIEAISRRVQLKAMEAGLDAVLGKENTGYYPDVKRTTGRVAVPDTSLTGRLAELSLALEDAWSWLPARTKARASRLFTIRPREGSPDQVHVQML